MPEKSVDLPEADENTRERNEFVQRLATMHDDTVLTMREVALWLDMKESWVRDRASGRPRPVIPAISVGKAYRFHWGTLKGVGE